ncbi:MAG: Dna2/Cas4 domain-containing protein, partial [Synergistaceae bacterium]|nr:Dna2/Cas4 domain-containing protein [Synergistaceae bacterium]
KIEELTERSAPPPAKMGKYCKKCAYAEHCWS